MSNEKWMAAFIRLIWAYEHLNVYIQHVCLLFEILPFNLGVEWMMSLRFEIMSLKFVNALFLFSVCSINGKTFFHLFIHIFS